MTAEFEFWFLQAFSIIFRNLTYSLPPKESRLFYLYFAFFLENRMKFKKNSKTRVQAEGFKKCKFSEIKK